MTTSSTPLFDSNGSPAEELLTLLHLAGVKHDSTLPSIRDATQLLWRKRTQHSGDISDAFAHLQGAATPLFEQLGFIGEQTAPQTNYYYYALIFGAYRLAIVKRLALLKRLWDNGLHFQHLVLLGTERAAHPEKESLQQLNTAEGGIPFRKDWEPLTEVPPTEADIMLAMLRQHDLPREWSQPGSYTFVQTPLRTDRPEKPDPSAEDALNYWMETSLPCTGTNVLGVYSQPQLRHIELVSRRILGRRNMHVDCVGYAAPGPVNVSQVLDTMAKVIHESAA